MGVGQCCEGLIWVACVLSKGEAGAMILVGARRGDGLAKDGSLYVFVTLDSVQGEDLYATGNGGTCDAVECLEMNWILGRNGTSMDDWIGLEYTLMPLQDLIIVSTVY